MVLLALGLRASLCYGLHAEAVIEREMVTCRVCFTFGSLKGAGRAFFTLGKIASDGGHCGYKDNTAHCRDRTGCGGVLQAWGHFGEVNRSRSGKCFTSAAIAHFTHHYIRYLSGDSPERSEENFPGGSRSENPGEVNISLGK